MGEKDTIEDRGRGGGIAPDSIEREKVERCREQLNARKSEHRHELDQIFGRPNTTELTDRAVLSSCFCVHYGNTETEFLVKTLTIEQIRPGWLHSCISPDIEGG